MLARFFHSVSAFTVLAASTILIGTAVALVCGCGSRSTSSSPSQTAGASAAQAQRELLSLGAAGRDADGQVVSLRLRGSDVTDAELQQLAEFGKLSELTVQECRVADDGLAALEQVSELKTLELIRVPVNDEGLRHLRSARSLDKLLLAHTEITGPGLRYLADTPVSHLSIHSRVVTAEGLSSLSELTSLRELELHCPEIQIEALASLVPMTELESLVTIRTPLGRAGLERIRGHQRLQKLILDASDVDDNAAVILNTLPELQELDLSNALITDEGLKQLSLPKLQTLSMCGCLGVTDAGLRNLQGMTSLVYLDLTEASVTGLDLTGLAVVPTLREVTMSGEQFKGNNATINALKKLLPNCEVFILRG